MENRKSDGMIRLLKTENGIDERILTKRCDRRLYVCNDASSSKYSIIDTKRSANYECRVDQYSSALYEDGKEDNTNKK